MISIITPTLWQRPEFILEAEKSLTEQTYKDIEWIVVSDKEQSIELKNSVKTKVIIDRNATNVSKARNVGIMSSSGEYVAFLDDDNLKDKEFSKSMIEAINGNDALFCFANLMKENNIIGTHHPSTLDYKTAWTLGGFYFTEEMFIKKDFLIRIGMFDEEMPMSEDYELAFRIMKHGKTEFAPHHLCTIRQHSGQLIQSDVVSKTQYCMVKLLRKHDRLGDNCYVCNKSLIGMKYPESVIRWIDVFRNVCSDCNNNHKD